MAKSTVQAYDSHSVADVFLRYTQNRRLLSLLAANIGDLPDQHHLDVGFSGRLALFMSLSDGLGILNYSKPQLDLGVTLLMELVSYYHDHLVSHDVEEMGRSATPRGPLLAAAMDVIEPIIREQVVVISAAGRVPAVPSDLRIYNCMFELDTLALDASEFDSLTMIDVVVHIESLEPIFREIARVLKPQARAVLTFFPPSRERSNIAAGVPCVDELFLKLCTEHGIRFEDVFDSVSNTVYPARFYEEAAKRETPADIDSLIRPYWLDLPSFHLHTEQSVIGQVRSAGLAVEQVETVPGGMYPACRQVLVVAKPHR